ncbi:MAG: hypothetical protein IPO95_00870 [Rhodanobacteraceae bacterium]|nr:hypothetical protein [Rhodanobacteraceae bacterium]
MRDLIASLLDEIRALEQRVVDADRALASTAKDDRVIADLEKLPTIGWVSNGSARIGRRHSSLQDWSRAVRLARLHAKGIRADRRDNWGA